MVGDKNSTSAGFNGYGLRRSHDTLTVRLKDGYCAVLCISFGRKGLLVTMYELDRITGCDRLAAQLRYGALRRVGVHIDRLWSL